MTSGNLMTFPTSVSSPLRKRTDRRLSNVSIKSPQELSTSDSSSSNSNTSNSKGIAKKRKIRCCRILDKEEIIKCFSVKEEEAAQLLNVSKSKLKRIKKEMGISRWPYRRLEALKQELNEIEQRIKSVNTHSHNNTFSPSLPSQVAPSISTSPIQQHSVNHQFILVSSSLVCSPPISSLQLEESILKGSIELIHHIPNIIVKHSNDHIKDIARKTQRISLSNLLNL